jgi:deoxyribose-phosphate aldolase
MNIASFIDHTILKPTTTRADITKLCEEANQYGFAAVCVPPPMIRYAKELTRNSSVKVATVIGFPFGYSSPAAKLAEVMESINDGVDELDVVINLIALKAGDQNHLTLEMLPIVKAAHQRNCIVKAIIESGILNDEEILFCCNLYSAMKVDFLKTSTGYAVQGATIESVKLMKTNLPATVKIKASGGIRTYDFAVNLIKAGADRLGCSSSVEIVSGKHAEKAGKY